MLLVTIVAVGTGGDVMAGVAVACEKNAYMKNAKMGYYQQLFQDLLNLVASTRMLNAAKKIKVMLQLKQIQLQEQSTSITTSLATMLTCILAAKEQISTSDRIHFENLTGLT